MLKDFAIVPLLPPLLLSHHPRTGQLLRPPGNCDCAVQAMEGVSCISTLIVNPDTVMDKTLAELLHAETQDEVESQPEDSCTDNAACIFELELPESPKEMRKMQKDPAEWTVDCRQDQTWMRSANRGSVQWGGGEVQRGKECRSAKLD